MKVLGIVCSPRRHGNTEILVQEALKSAEEAGAEVEMFTIAGKTIFPCDACESCSETGKCHIKDDMQPLYGKMLEADGIIFGSPVWMWTVCAQALIILNRTHVFGREKRLRNKVGAAVIAPGRAGGTSAFSVFNNYFNRRRMICAGGAIGFGFGKGDVRKDEQGLHEARSVGRAVVRYIKQMAQSTPREEKERQLTAPQERRRYGDHPSLKK